MLFFKADTNRLLAAVQSISDTGVVGTEMLVLKAARRNTAQELQEHPALKPWAHNQQQ